MKGDPKDLGFSTRAIHAGQAPDPTTGAVTVPIYQTSTYVQPGLGEGKGFDYARVQNPTRTALEENVASLERGLSGHAFASGMAAIAAVTSIVESGEHMVVSENVYGGTYRFLDGIARRQGIELSFVDTRDLDAVEAAMREETRLVHIETPTNPMMQITDIAAVSEIAHRHDALVVVDNTFLSPYLQQPLRLGADLVVHSTTKFLNGHSDSLGGVAVATRPADREWLRFVQKSAGAVLAPLECFLVLRGIKTLPVRMERHEQNARAVADFLVRHPRVEKVFYPGLPEHPGHHVQKRQASGFGALISFELGSREAAKTFLDGLRVASLGESLGGVETLISHPATMTHGAVPAPERERLGISDGLARISVGLEDLEDLLSDLEQALALL